LSKEWDSVPRMSMSGILERSTEFTMTEKFSGCDSAETKSPRAWMLLKE